MAQEPPLIQHTHSIPNPPKPPIQCLHSFNHPDSPARSQPALLFTHGAGGTLSAPAVANFITGFVGPASAKSVFAFQGNMNLNSRVGMFGTIIDASPISTAEGNVIEVGAKCLGGRSMGARAAVMAVRQETRALVLVSYPLHTGKAVRDQILLDIPEHVKVVFVTGDGDEMCDLNRLEDVRRKMKCPTWRVVVGGADHGMNCKPKASTEEVQREIGRVVAGWVDGVEEEDKREGKIVWDEGEGGVRWSGWSDGGDVGNVADARRERKPATKVEEEQRKSGSRSAKGTQLATKRKAQDQNAREKGDGLRKQKSSKSRNKSAKDARGAKKRKAQGEDISKEGDSSMKPNSSKSLEK